MNLTDMELFDLALAMVICIALIALLIIFIFAPLSKSAEPLKIAQAEAGQINKSVGAETEQIQNARAAKKRLLLWDSFALVPVYSGFLIVTGFLLGGKTAAWAQASAKVLILAAIIAAASDWIENYYLYFALDDKITWATCLKWLAIFTATGIASLIFLRLSLNIWNVAGALLLAASIIGAASVAVSGFDSNKIENSKAIIGSFGFQLLILLVVGIIFLLFERCRENFING